MKERCKQLFCTAAALLIGAAPLTAPARAGSFDAPSQETNISAAETSGVTVVEHVGAPLPLDLPFVDETGKPVRLGEYFTGRKPVVLQLGYYGCPMLCGLISRGLVDAVKQVSLTAGKDYELVFVSIDPNETPALASRKKESYLQEYGRESAAGWHFLTGKQSNIAALAQADGFKYKWIESAGQFAHPPSLTLCMPDGRISRYLSGVRFDPLTLRESLVEASNGQVGNAADQLYLTCFRYDGAQGKYAMAAVSLMRAGGVLIMIVVGAVLIRLFQRERKLRARQEAAPAGQ